MSPKKSLFNPLNDLKKLNPLNYRITAKQRLKTGLAPGSLIYTGEQHTDKVIIEVLDYTDDHLEEVNIVNLNELKRYNQAGSVSWINIQGLHDVEVIGEIGRMLGLHPLTMEDILDTNQRPKVEEFEDHLYLSMKMINHHNELKRIDVEQISIILHKNFVICFQEKPGDIFDDIRNRLRNGKGRARKRGSDYLAYMLLDIIIDYYFETLDAVWTKIEALEDRVVNHPEKVELKNIQIVRTDLIHLRRLMHPVKDVVQSLTNRNALYFDEGTLMFIRDSYDHSVQVVENLDTYREILTSIMDLYLSQLSMKMNEVMKVLTTIATIFIPLTFVAGIYGMNFEKMPELGWELSYPVGFYSLIGVLTLGMLIYMKTKKWL